MDLYIPQPIQNYLGNSVLIENTVSASSAKVLVYPANVLIIQPASAETRSEWDVTAWAGGRLPLPPMPLYLEEDGLSYILVTRLRGREMTDPSMLNNPRRAVHLAALGLKLLWATDLRGCPTGTSPLPRRLAAARTALERGLVNTDRAAPDTYGPDGFRDPAHLLEWLEAHQPPLDQVLSHGSFRLSNLFSDGRRITGFTHLGRMGPADRWQDLALCLEDLQRHFGSTPGFSPQMLLDELGVEMDEEKYRYYRLLNELF